MTEIEVKILEINRDSVEKKLIALGARKIFDDEIHAIYYDLQDNGLKKTGKALRLRKEGKKTNLTLKLHGENALAKEREEHEVEVRHQDFCRRVMSRGKFPYAVLDLLLSPPGEIFLSEISLKGGRKGSQLGQAGFRARARCLEEEFGNTWAGSLKTPL